MTFDEELLKASKLSPKELRLINSTTLKVIGGHGQRPVVVFALAASLIGCAIRASDGQIDREGAMKWVDLLIQL